jgi:hypothetical protein
LAEKQMIAGNDDLAFRLVEAADKSTKCHFCDKKAEMMKRKGKKDIHVCKTCGKDTKCALRGCSAKMMFGEMIKRGGKAYCCNDCAKKDSTMKKTALDEMLEKYAGEKLTFQKAKEELSLLGISIKKHDGEYCVNFKGGEEETAYYTDDLGDALGTGKQMVKSKEKKASANDKGSYKDAIKKIDGFTGMFGDAFCFNTKSQAQEAISIAESAANFLNWKIERHDDGFMLIPRGFDKKSTINAGDLLRKYSQGEDFGDSPDEEEKTKLSDLSDTDSEEILDHLSNIMAEGYDAGKSDEDKCPYATNTDEWFAWQAGWKAAGGDRMPDYPENFAPFAFGDSDQSSDNPSTLADLLNNFDSEDFSSKVRNNLVKYLKD